MYVLKNSLKNIQRSPIRNLLIGIIIVVIFMVCCMSLSLFRFADKATTEALRSSALIARVTKGDILESIDTSEKLNYGEIIEFASLQYVFDTYLEYKTEMISVGTNSRHTAIGYSSGIATKYFRYVEKLVMQGRMFDPWSEAPEYLVSTQVKDCPIDSTILLSPNNADEIFEFRVVGRFTSSELNKDEILIPLNVLESILDLGNNTKMTSAFAINHPDNIEPFREFVAKSNIDGNSYRAFFSGVQKFKDTFHPIESTKNVASIALGLSLIIGCSILIVLGVFNTNERQYEVGVLSSIGMPKKEIVLQFITEMMDITLISAIIGIVVSIPFSVMSTRSLLAPQVNTNMTFSLRRQVGQQLNVSFWISKDDMVNWDSTDDPFDKSKSTRAGYRTDDTRDTDLVTIMNKTTDLFSAVKAVLGGGIVISIIVIAITLAFISGFASIIFVVRFNPLKILNERVN